ncbi:hypothetical protein FNF29_05583 [Cafeteria roenbergensis]|uniref:Major facilitator superfamily (MFS) profile domain-containing protein n=2 Tax=Cafeteria roenbergensis TaxID=33653 RepID=A0A5A8CA21_CAFRO|nr:hypothetical protein FNF29_05583 [Cafeteria roenbergensis]|eukprot:KAA0149963.1 hypothetical protein FNF29_05583 [Cafeteria roenbergensis]
MLTPGRERLGTAHVLGLTAFGIGAAVWLYAFVLLIVPSEIADIVSARGVGEAAAHAKQRPHSASDQGTSLGLALLVGALVSVGSSPLLGSISDRARTPCGRRVPFVLGGVAGAALASVGLYRSATFWSYTAWFAVMQACLAMAMTAFNGLIYERVPAGQRGMASGVMGGSVAAGNMLGALLGAVYAATGRLATFALVFALVALSALTTALFSGDVDAYVAAVPLVGRALLALRDGDAAGLAHGSRGGPGGSRGGSGGGGYLDLAGAGSVHDAADGAAGSDANCSRAEASPVNAPRDRAADGFSGEIDAAGDEGSALAADPSSPGAATSPAEGQGLLASHRAEAAALDAALAGVAMAAAGRRHGRAARPGHPAPGPLQGSSAGQLPAGFSDADEESLLTWDDDVDDVDDAGISDIGDIGGAGAGGGNGAASDEFAVGAAADDAAAGGSRSSSAHAGAQLGNTTALAAAASAAAALPPGAGNGSVARGLTARAAAASEARRRGPGGAAGAAASRGLDGDSGWGDGRRPTTTLKPRGATALGDRGSGSGSGSGGGGGGEEGAKGGVRGAAHCACGRRLGCGSFLDPFADNDFLWAFLSRMAYQQAVYTVQTYLLYYIRDAVALPAGMQPQTALSVVMLPLLCCALLSPLVTGYASDAAAGAKRLILLGAGLSMAVVTALMAVVRTWSALPWLAAAFGAGYGTFNALDFALAMDVLPGGDGSAAKDLGLWNLALAIPMCLAAPSGGIVLDKVNAAWGNNAGYTVLFGMAASLLLVGVAALLRVRRLK